MQLSIGSRIDGDEMAGLDHRCDARARDEEVRERQWAHGQRRRTQRHHGGRLVPRKRRGPRRGPIAVEFTFALAGRAAGTHGSYNGTRSQGTMVEALLRSIENHSYDRPSINLQRQFHSYEFPVSKESLSLL